VEKKENKPAEKEDKKEDVKPATAQAPAPEPTKPSTAEKKPSSATASKPPYIQNSRAPSVTGDDDQPAESRDADAVAKEQEEQLDETIVQDMYGKEHVNVVFIGHVDAGKSTLGGNILFLTGMVDERTMEKYEKEAREAGRESWYLSWALDTNKEERAKGKTVEVGRARFETEKRRYTILDAPGHKSYVPNMISGAAQADVGVLVISARKGEFETGFDKGGQTREHAVLAKMQGINKLVVVINKMDDPTVEWSKERFDECTKRLGTFLKGNGFNPKTDLFFIPISAYKGSNLKDRVDKQICPWWDGLSLLEYLDSMTSLERKIKAPLMMPIGGKFRVPFPLPYES
jgi:peptide chain release factor subunit 3